MAKSSGDKSMPGSSHKSDIDALYSKTNQLEVDVSSINAKVDNLGVQIGNLSKILQDFMRSSRPNYGTMIAGASLGITIILAFVSGLAWAMFREMDHVNEMNKQANVATREVLELKIQNVGLQSKLDHSGEGKVAP